MNIRVDFYLLNFLKISLRRFERHLEHHTMVNISKDEIWWFFNIRIAVGHLWFC